MTEHDNLSKNAKMPSSKDIEFQADICRQFLYLSQRRDYNIQQFDINMFYFEKFSS